MLIFRLLLLLGLMACGATLAVYLWTRNPRHLRFFWQVLKFSGLFLLLFLVVQVLGRLLLR